LKDGNWKQDAVKENKVQETSLSVKIKLTQCSTVLFEGMIVLHFLKIFFAFC